MGDINELFDLEHDLYEINNLMKNKEMDKIGLPLMDDLINWLEKTNGLRIPLKNSLKERAIIYTGIAINRL